MPCISSFQNISGEPICCIETQNLSASDLQHHQRSSVVQTMSELVQRLQSMDDKSHFSLEREFFHARKRSNMLDSDAEKLKDNIHNTVEKHQQYIDR